MEQRICTNTDNFFVASFVESRFLLSLIRVVRILHYPEPNSHESVATVELFPALSTRRTSVSLGRSAHLLYQIQRAPQVWVYVCNDMNNDSCWMLWKHKAGMSSFLICCSTACCQIFSRSLELSVHQLKWKNVGRKFCISNPKQSSEEQGEYVCCVFLSFWCILFAATLVECGCFSRPPAHLVVVLVALLHRWTIWAIVFLYM